MGEGRGGEDLEDVLLKRGGGGGANPPGMKESSLCAHGCSPPALTCSRPRDPVAERVRTAWLEPAPGRANAARGMAERIESSARPAEAGTGVPGEVAEAESEAEARGHVGLAPSSSSCSSRATSWPPRKSSADPGENSVPRT